MSKNIFNVQNNSNNFLKISSLTAILVLTFLLSYLFITKDTNNNIITPFSSVENVANEPTIKMVENPLTGELFEENSATWYGQRPIGVMINNHVSARPQSGLINADIVYEVVAEGGITRFLSFFLSDLPEKIGPVRSTREYYLVLVKELADSMIMHIGYSPQALEAIQTWPVRSLSRGGAEFYRDTQRLNAGIATEHTAYVDGPYLRKLGKDLGWDGVGKIDTYSFKNEKSIINEENLVNEISIDFWYPGDYSAIFKYNSEENNYLRFMGYDENQNPIAHLDQESNDQIKVTNLIVQFVTESSIEGDDKNRLEYELVGSGEGIVFIDGTSIHVTWSKLDRDSRTKFYDLNGQEVLFNRGNFWISVVPDRNKEQVVY